MTAHVITFGETMALVSSQVEGRLANSRSVNIGIGGAESNFSIGLARLGTAVVWVGRIGDDSLGDLVEREIRAEGVRTFAVRDSSAPTGLMVKERRTTSTSRVFYYRSGSAGSRISKADIPASLIESARLLHVTGITPALSDSARESVDFAIRVAHEAGVPVSFDLNYRTALWSREAAAASFRHLIPQCEIVFAGQDEARLVLGDSAETASEQARGLTDLGAKLAVIKLGAEGAHAYASNADYVQAPFLVDALDTVGAGDAFAAGFVSEYIQGSAIQDCLQIAAACGAYATLGTGDWESLPTRHDITSLANGSDPVQR